MGALLWDILMTPQMTGFWINNNVVYAGNGSAMSWTDNKISYAPSNIDFFAIKSC